MAKMRKGVISTIAILFLVLVIFSISFLVFKQGIAGKKAIAENIATEIIKNKFFAVQYAIYQMFWNTTGINISSTSSGLYFTHSIPTRLDIFSGNVTAFSNYVSTSMPEIKITPNFGSGNISLQYYNPSNLAQPYEYIIAAGTPNKIILDFDPASTFYVFRIYSPDFNGTPAFSRITTGTVNVSVVVTGTSSYYASTGALIDPTSGLTDSAVVIGGLSNVVNISIYNSKFILSDYLGNPGNLTLTTSINITDRRNIYLPTRIFINESRIWKNGTPRIY